MNILHVESKFHLVLKINQMQIEIYSIKLQTQFIYYYELYLLLFYKFTKS